MNLFFLAVVSESALDIDLDGEHIAIFFQCCLLFLLFNYKGNYWVKFRSFAMTSRVRAEKRY
jgi:hypothetical protein